MLLLGCLGVLSGLMFGRCCSVFVLFPAHLVAALAVAIASAGRGTPFGEGLEALIAWSVACQAGFLLAAWATTGIRPGRESGHSSHNGDARA